ncbi:integral membrane protein [Legionella busanensis]|uniref:Integral membrane protein n=1 Tax=Legionella busanensis TaxID=190655 RepID=A0A378JKJ9_9GAMM|nr:EamA family transporter [Legionella busanensis]STX50650.1 integral membrane protein [Legionella busanensis]
MRKVNCAIALALLFWASAFVGIRFSLESYTPGALALLRFIIASICMGIIYLRLPNKNKMPWLIRIQLLLIGVGAIGIYNICLNTGELTISASIASFIIGINPVLTILLSIILFKERTHFGIWLGVGISMFGLLLMALGGKNTAIHIEGVLIIFVATIMSAIYNLTQGLFLKTYHPIVVTSWVIWGGTLFLSYFIFDLKQEFFKASYEATFVVIYMGIFSAALAYLCWSYVLANMPVSRASIYSYALPLYSTALGFLFLGEKPSAMSFAGGVIALAGAFIAKQPQRSLATTAVLR